LKLEDAIFAVHESLIDKEGEDPFIFQTLCLAVEIGIRAVYKAGLVIVETDGFGVK
jgi:hypothetical protein